LRVERVKLSQNTKNWDDYFMRVADAAASNSKCRSRKVGAVIVKDKVIVCTGYNGPPRGMPECDRRGGIVSETGRCFRRFLGFGPGEGLEWCTAAHAEANAVFQAARLGICVFGAKIYLNVEVPCLNCMNAIVQSGIEEVICKSLNLYGGTNEITWEWYLRNVSVKIRDMEGNTFTF